MSPMLGLAPGLGAGEVALFLVLGLGLVVVVVGFFVAGIYNRLVALRNRYKNAFGTEIALFRTSEGGMSRMAVSWDTPGSGVNKLYHPVKTAFERRT